MNRADDETMIVPSEYLEAVIMKRLVASALHQATNAAEFAEHSREGKT